MTNLSEAQFDVLVRHYDALPSTRSIVHTIDVYKKKQVETHLHMAVNYSQVYERYKEGFNDYLLKKKGNGYTYTDRWLHNHFINKYKDNGTVYVHRNKWYWIWLGTVLFLSAVLVVLIILGATGHLR